jgi:hypothetical protein
MAIEDYRILGPLTQCGCKGAHRICLKGQYIGNDAGSICRHYRLLPGTDLEHCERTPNNDEIITKTNTTETGV